MGRIVVWLFLALPVVASSHYGSKGLVESKSASNVALLVGVAHGLPGIDLDVQSVEEMVRDKAYQYEAFQINNLEATTQSIPIELAKKAALAGKDGSFFFYFSGHGSVDNILLEDSLMGVDEMRQAIELARKNIGPLSRLILMFDSCYSGSLLGPFRLFPRLARFDVNHASALVADRLVRAFNDRDAKYWNKLFVFASSREDETSLASETGSIFTLALRKAFDEVMTTNGTMQEWVDKTKLYTEGHHPVERMVPSSMNLEKMDPFRP